MIKSAAEARIEVATWGLVLIWVGLVMAFDFRKGIPALVAGSILLLSGVIQKAIRGRAGMIVWVAGIALVLSGVNDLTHGRRHVPVFAVIAIIIGAALLGGALAGGRGVQRRIQMYSGHWTRGPRDPHERP
jgi:hypothetical protein